YNSRRGVAHSLLSFRFVRAAQSFVEIDVAPFAEAGNLFASRSIQGDQLVGGGHKYSSVIAVFPVGESPADSAAQTVRKWVEGPEFLACGGVKGKDFELGRDAV